VIAEAGLVDTSRYTAQYELLRSQVIGARCEAPRQDAVDQPRGVGLALMICEGMPGWLKAIAAVLRESPPVHCPDTAGATQPQPSAGYNDAPAWLSGVPRRDLTALLTSLVLSTRPAERASPREEDRSWH
jgi:hypothetical protein